MKDIDSINDVFVISTSGIPYYSGCFGGENCSKEPNHLLVSGFLAAVFQFSMQFGQKSIREIVFDEAQMAIEINRIGDHQVLTILFADKKIKMKKLGKLATETAKAFEKTFSEVIQQPKYSPRMSDFKSFSQILNKMGIIDKDIMGEAPILNSCEYSSVSDKRNHIYCKKQQKNVPLDEELKYKAMDKCPHLS